MGRLVRDEQDEPEARGYSVFVHFADVVVVMFKVMGSKLEAVIFWVLLRWILMYHYPLTLRSILNSVVFVYSCGLLLVYKVGRYA